MVVMFDKVTANTELMNTEPRGNTGLGAYELLVTKLSSTDQYLILFEVHSVKDTLYNIFY